MKSRLKIVVALSVFSIAGVSAYAGGPIGIDDFSGSEQVITFTPGFSQQCDAFEYEGVIFDEDGGGSGGACFNAVNDWGGFFSNIPGSSQGIGFHDQWGESKIIMIPPAGTTRFGCLLSTGVQTDFTLSLYDASGNLLGSTTTLFRSHWLDSFFSSGIFWTGTLLVLGTAFGCFLAWKRLSEEQSK